MWRIFRHAQEILGRFIVIGFGIQIILGIYWMGKAFAKGLGGGIVGVGKFVLFVMAMWFFLTTLWRGKSAKALFGSLAIAAFPMVLQCHLAEGVDSYLTSGLLLGTACACRLLRDRQKKSRIAGWFLAIGMTGLSVWGGTIAGQNSLNLMTNLTERFAWSSLYLTYQCLPEESQELVNYWDMGDSTYEAVGVKNILLPSLERTAGDSKNQVIQELIQTAWRHRKKQIVKEIFWDTAGYAAAPLIVPLQLARRAYDSYTGLNYRQILRVEPALGRIYMSYGCGWFAISLAGTFVLWIAGAKRKISAEGRMLLIVCLLMVLLDTVSNAGQMDYKATCFVLCMWLTWMETVAVRCWEPSEEKKIAGKEE